MWAKVAAIAALVVFSGSAWAQFQPTPPVPSEDVQRQLNDLNDQVNELPDDPTAGIMPSVNARPLLGYLKWLTSYSALQELFGEDFAPLANIAVMWFYAMFALTAIYIIIRAIVLLAQFIKWILDLTLKIIDLILKALDIVIPF